MRKNHFKDTVSNFGFQTAKAYMIAVIIAFHIVPIGLVILGDKGLVLMGMILMVINPMFVFISGLLYGIKQGYTWKFPLFTALVFAPSIIMYYNSIKTPEELVRAITATLVYTIVYFIFSVVSTFFGGVVNKYF